MAQEKIRITGLFSRMAPFGEVLSAKVKRADILEALAKVPGEEVELSVMPVGERKNDRSPTHSLKVGEPWRKNDSQVADNELF